MKDNRRKFVDDGWALWIDGDDRSTMYLNEWVNPQGKNYVDVGVRIYGAKGAGAINFFVPFEVEKYEITDLSYMLADISVLRALFNTNGKVDSEKTRYTSELSYDDRTVSLVNLSEDFVLTKKVAYGTIITIDFDFIKDCMTSDEAYLIFRIPHKSLDSMFSSTASAVGIFEKIKLLIQSPIISKKYGYSIRINEARLLPPEINDIEALNTQKIKKALVTISLNDKYEINESGCYRIRRLEADLNRNYAPEGYECDDAITYQWVEERSVNMKAHYNFFFTLHHNEISKSSMFFYLIIALLIGVMDGALYDFFKFILSKF